MRRLAVYLATLALVVGSLLHISVARHLNGAPISAAVTVLAEPLSPAAVSVGWPAFGTGTHAYHVYRSNRLVGVVYPDTKLNFVEQSLSASTSYTYDVYAVNDYNTFVWGNQVSVTSLAATPLQYVTTFEEDTTVGTALIGGWDKLAADTTKISASTDQAAAGSRSVRFQFDYSDWSDADCCNRSQLIQSAGLQTFSTLGTVRWVGIATYYETFPPDNTNNPSLVWQFHGASGGPGRYGPPVALYQVGTEQRLQLNNTAGVTFACSTQALPHPDNNVLATFNLADDIGRWVDWVIKVNFDYTGGSLDVWKDGVHVVTYSGSTIFHCDDQVNETGPYFDFGPYKWNWGLNSTLVNQIVMYADEVRFGDNSATCADVKPTGAADCAP